MNSRRMVGVGAMIASAAFGRFCWDPNTGTFNSALGYALAGAAGSYWMITARPTKYDGWIASAGLVAGLAAVSAIVAFNKEYGGGRPLL